MNNKYDKMNSEWKEMFLDKSKLKNKNSIELKELNCKKNEFGIEAFEYFKNETNKLKKINNLFYKKYVNENIYYLNKKINKLISENKNIDKKLKHLDKQFLNLEKMAKEINEIENLKFQEKKSIINSPII